MRYSNLERKCVSYILPYFHTYKCVPLPLKTVLSVSILVIHDNTFLIQHLDQRRNWLGPGGSEYSEKQLLLWSASESPSRVILGFCSDDVMMLYVEGVGVCKAGKQKSSPELFSGCFNLNLCTDNIYYYDFQVNLSRNDSLILLFPWYRISSSLRHPPNWKPYNVSKVVWLLVRHKPVWN